MKNEKIIKYRSMSVLLQEIWQQKLLIASFLFLALYLLYGMVACIEYFEHTKQLRQDTVAYADTGESPYFNTTFLKQYDLVRKYLKKDGFQEGSFVTEDGVTIAYLLLERPHATHTVIVCCGWLPGRKEGLASLYPLLPASSNVLLFDARGHGGSSGSLLGSLLRYGQHEYKDIIAAIQFVHTTLSVPIIIFGTCAGAFHAAHALVELERRGCTHQLNIKGLIFDSGWASLTVTSQQVPKAKIREVITHLFSFIVGKKYAATSSIVHMLAACGNTITDGLHLLYSYCIAEEQTNLFSLMSAISIPILFVHSYDDAYVSINQVIELSQQVACKECWWIDKPSRHACHHLKHKDAYKEKLAHFIDTLLKDTNTIDPHCEERILPKYKIRDFTFGIPATWDKKYTFDRHCEERSEVAIQDN